MGLFDIFRPGTPPKPDAKRSFYIEEYPVVEKFVAYIVFEMEDCGHHKAALYRDHETGTIMASGFLSPNRGDRFETYEMALAFIEEYKDQSQHPTKVMKLHGPL